MQNFEQIRSGGYMYVDKTDFVWQIANDKQNNFLSRPRRFGKSLLTSTLACYLEGKKELFHGLKIMELEQHLPQEEQWPQRHVFRFDFSGYNTAIELKSYINTVISRWEEVYGRDKADENLQNRFLTLMEKAHKATGHQVAVLVDEYDSPLQHTLFKEKEHEALADIYRSFFPAMKTGSEHLKCLFLTGVTKFTQLSLFSTLNNVSILSTLPQYATVCGITHQEMVDNFLPELKAMGEANGWSVEQTVDKLRDMYDGYHFSENLDENTAVYNPYSLINALDTKRISNYWASSGGSTLLSELLERVEVEKDTLEGSTVSRDRLEMADVSLQDVPLFLYQCGYLTIKECDEDEYTLGIPNKEVQRALYNIVLPNALNQPYSTVDSNLLDIKRDLKHLDVESAMRRLQQLVAETPYAHNSKEYINEERYRYLLRIAFYLMGCTIEEERHVATGIIDLVVKHPACILVMELKLDNNGGLQAAKDQLADRSYASAYRAEKKPLYAIAVELSSSKRGITAWDIQAVK